MREAQSTEIDGLTFEVQQMPGKLALRISHRLARALGPAVLKGLSSGGDLKSFLKSQVSGAALASALESFFDKLPEDEFLSVAEALLKTAFVTEDGKRQPLWPVFDGVFAGRPLVAFQLLKFALEVNFSGFFDMLRAHKPSAEAPKP